MSVSGRLSRDILLMVGYIFQEDNVPTHKANLVKRYFHEKNTIPILWPMCSPDLSPIDNCGSLVKMRLQKEIR